VTADRKLSFEVGLCHTQYLGFHLGKDIATFLYAASMCLSIKGVSGGLAVHRLRDS